jgi:hypothetical protein
MKIIATILCTVFYVLTFSQNSKRNIVYGEIIGVTGTYSINYERVITQNDFVSINLRGGLAYLFGNEEFKSYVLVPLSTSLLKPIENGHNLELRLSFHSAIYYDYRSISVSHFGGDVQKMSDEKKLGWGGAPGLALGYRYQPSDKKMFANLLYQTTWFFDDESWYKHLSIGLGFSF